MSARIDQLRSARWAAAALALAAIPGTGWGASLSVQGGAIVLGRTESASVIIQVEEPPGTEVLPLRLSVNVGQFSEPTRLGPGRYRATYVPPAARYPQVALVAVWRETGVDARIDFLRIPLFGMTRVRVAAKPRAEVKVQVGIDTFGPVVADRTGRAEVPIRVEPGVNSAAVAIREAEGVEVAKTVPVEVPPYNRITAALVPHAVVADGTSRVRLDVFYDLGGARVPPEQVRVTPSIGKVTFEGGARGLYTYRYVPPPDVPATTVTFKVSVQGDPQARAATQLSLGLPPPSQVLVSGPAKRLRVGSGATGSASVLVLDSAGMGLPGLEVVATAAGKPLSAPVYKGGGLYEFELRAPDAYPPGGVVLIRARGSGTGKTVDGNLNLQLDAPPVPSTVTSRIVPSVVPADGHTEARVLLEVRDAAGMPLEHVQLVAVASHGTLGELREHGNGIYEYTYLPPSGLPEAEAELRVTDGTGGFERRFPLPLRPESRRLLLGAGGGYAVSPGDGSGPRMTAEGWVPLGGAGGRFGAGLSVGYGTASKTVSDPSGTLSSRTHATFVPLALKVGWDAFVGRRLTLTVGGGASLAWAEFKTSLAGGYVRAIGAGGLGFAAVGWTVGPGQAVLELSYGSAPVETADFRVDPGGFSTTLVYRLGVL